MDGSPYNLISVIIYSLSCCPKPVFIYFLCWTQNKIFWWIWVTKQLLVHIDFDSRKNMEVTEDQQLFGFPGSSK